MYSQFMMHGQKNIKLIAVSGSECHLLALAVSAAFVVARL